MLTLRTKAARKLVEANARDATFMKEGSESGISTDWISACLSSNRYYTEEFHSLNSSAMFPEGLLLNWATVVKEIKPEGFVGKETQEHSRDLIQHRASSLLEKQQKLFIGKRLPAYLVTSWLNEYLQLHLNSRSTPWSSVSSVSPNS